MKKRRGWMDGGGRLLVLENNVSATLFSKGVQEILLRTKRTARG
jgi:hypothetical protein